MKKTKQHIIEENVTEILTLKTQLLKAEARVQNLEKEVEHKDEQIRDIHQISELLVHEPLRDNVTLLLVENIYNICSR